MQGELVQDLQNKRDYEQLAGSSYTCKRLFHSFQLSTDDKAKIFNAELTYSGERWVQHLIIM